VPTTDVELRDSFISPRSYLLACLHAGVMPALDTDGWLTPAYAVDVLGRVRDRLLEDAYDCDEYADHPPAVLNTAAAGRYTAHWQRQATAKRIEADKAERLRLHLKADA
jgi:hypothetical protein